MALETSTTIEGLNQTWPDTTDRRNQGDDHIRMIKSVLKATFPGENGNGLNTAINVKETELNYLAGLTGPIQELLDAKAPLSSPALSNATVNSPAVGDNSQRVPNTSWVRNQISTDIATLKLSAKAWAFFDATNSIINSYGIASVVDAGAGEVYVNFSGSINNPCIVGTADSLVLRVITSIHISSTQCRIRCFDSSGFQADPANYQIVIFGD